ncbi:MAG: class I tRNA ligase family protein, partial [Bacteroidota bacterium]
GITKEDIGKKISVEEYNQKCREAVLRYKQQWDDLTKQMGYWVDLKNPYITFKNEYIETLWWCLKELYNKGLLYKSVSIQPYSPAAGTGLSSHELNQPGTYKMVKDTSAVAMFRLTPNPSPAESERGAASPTHPLYNLLERGVGGEVFFLAWTTTPWTLPSNLGLTVGPNIEYVLVKTFNPYTYQQQIVILAQALLNKYFKEEGATTSFDNYKEGDKIIPYKTLATFRGKELEGLEYEQILPSPA